MPTFHSANINELAKETTRLQIEGIESFTYTKPTPQDHCMSVDPDTLVDKIITKVLEKIQGISVNNPEGNDYNPNIQSVNNKRRKGNRSFAGRRNFRGRLGRDFLSQFRTVQFDFQNNKIKLGSLWYNCVTLNENNGVKLTNAVSLPARSEIIVNVHCGKSFSLLTTYFDPLTLSETPGAYATRCRIFPNIEGGFKSLF